MVEVLPRKGHPGDPDARVILFVPFESAAPGGFPVAEAKDLTAQVATSLRLHSMAGFLEKCAQKWRFLERSVPEVEICRQKCSEVEISKEKC